MTRIIAKIAVSAATYWVDRPFDYIVPENLTDAAVPGVRVFVPFGRGNRQSEGIILALSDHSDCEPEKLKPITAVLDDEPLLPEDFIKLALFMRDRFFCTVYSAFKAMLPAGLWVKEDGSRRVNDKFIEMARLCVSAEEASEFAERKRARSEKQASILEQLCAFECLPTADLLTHSGANRTQLKALVKAEVVELYKREAFRRPKIHVGMTEPLPVLSPEQQKAFSGLNDMALSDKPCVGLLFGVTGSGKTSVYLHLIMEQLNRGKSALLLVPEISLTPQMIQTFSTYFGNEVAVLHSSLSTGERYDEWKRIRSGKARVIIGTRSAVFAPTDRLGLIIIDEEQEETYKSENTPRYNARDVAKYRVNRAGCLLVLGSATPEVSSMYNAETGRYTKFCLRTRYNDMMLPRVEIVDMKNELKSGNGGNISLFLRDELQKNIDAGEQSILFLNRRGAHKLVSCGECGYTFKCRRCSVSLTYHSSNNRLICHYCGFSQPVSQYCPDCGGTLKFIGAGTQSVEEELSELFPSVPVLRMDTDTVAPAGSHEILFERFRKENIPIMVGTQMVTKGLNFENVTLVGVISADQSLYAGDYRAGERAFSMITQVIGRSGRGSKPGRAVIQTFTPGNETILLSARQDYEDFYRAEIELRRLQNAPPFTDIIAVTATGEVENHVYECCRQVRKRLLEYFGTQINASVLGPVPLSVVKVNNRFRYRVNICACPSPKLRAIISAVVIELSTDKRFSDVSVYAENDPRD